MIIICQVISQESLHTRYRKFHIKIGRFYYSILHFFGGNCMTNSRRIYERAIGEITIIDDFFEN